MAVMGPGGRSSALRPVAPEGAQFRLSPSAPVRYLGGMRMRQDPGICRLVVVVVMAALTVQADGLRDPRRIINGQTVDLSPLFRWWTAKEGARPLGAWVRVTGSVVGSSVWGWTLEAQIQKVPQAANDGETNPVALPQPLRIILKNPPQQQQAEFDKLVAQRQALEGERTRLSDLAASSGQAAAQAAKQYDSSRPWKLQSSVALDGIGQARMVEADARARLKSVDEQLAEIKRKLAGYPDPNRYMVDCFALDSGEKQRGVPVYDHGRVFN